MALLLRAAAHEILIIRIGQSGLREPGALERRKRRLRAARVAAGEIAVGAGGSADQRGREVVVRKFLFRRTQEKTVGAAEIRGRQLLRPVEMRTRSRILVRIQFDDALREQVVDVFPLGCLIGCEDMIEAAIFTNDHDDMLDGRDRVAETRVRRARGRREYRPDRKLKQDQRT